jgi:hypothetical protein
MLRYYLYVFEILTKIKKISFQYKKSRNSLLIYRAHEKIDEDKNLENKEEEKILEKLDTKNPYQTFVDLLSQLVEEKINFSTFEEGTKKILGNESYIALNFDNVFTIFKKYLTNTLRDKPSVQLINFFYLETLRTKKFLNDDNYFKRCCAIIDSNYFYYTKYVNFFF